MDEDAGTHRRPLVMLGWLGHPVTVLSTVALVLNDHLLKAAYPGLVTGKLSDVAGLLVLPPLLATLVAGLAPRLSGRLVALAALGVTGLAFTLVKVTAAGAVAVSVAWSQLTGPSVILADRTDLVALPALGLAGWVWTRGRRRPASRRAVRRFGVLVMVPGAVLAVAATSAPDYPDTTIVTTWRGSVVLGQANAYHGDREPERWWLGERDGRTWRALTPDERATFEAERSGLAAGTVQGCVPDEPARCYRVAPGRLRVEETADGGASWRTGWEVSEERRRYLARVYDDLGDPDVSLSSLALVVHPAGSAHIVVVANGRDGAVIRNVDGSWTQIAFSGYGGPAGPAQPGGVDPAALAPELVLALLAVLVVVGAGGGLAARRGRRPVGWLLVALGVGCLLTALGLAGLDSAGAIYARLAVLVAPLIALAGAIGVVVMAGFALRARWLVLIILIGLATGVAWLVPFVAWAYGGPDYRAAALFGLTGVLVGSTVSGWLGHRFGRPRQPGSRPPGPPSALVRPPVSPG